MPETQSAAVAEAERIVSRRYPRYHVATGTERHVFVGAGVCRFCEHEASGVRIAVDRGQSSLICFDCIWPLFRRLVLSYLL